MFKKTKIDIEYEKLKRKASISADSGDVEAVNLYTSLAANLAYTYMLCYEDGELEKLVVKISHQVSKDISVPIIENRVVFYDTHGRYQKGLTQQYLRAFNKLGIEVLYIYDSQVGEHLEGGLYEELFEYTNVKVFNVNSSSTFKEKFLDISDEIISWGPSKIFMHIYPWSILPLTLMCALNGPKKFLINWTDHAFWLGKNFADIFICFSKYGISVAQKYRGIPIDRLTYLPYYPIIEDLAPYRGIPDGGLNSIKILTAGAVYKMLNERQSFFYALKKIIDTFENSIVYIVSSGDDGPIKKFIKKYQLDSKIRCLGTRDDFFSIVSNCDIYLDTYPIGGGLTVQYALEAHKPVIAIEDEDLLGWSPQEEFAIYSHDSVGDYSNFNYINKIQENIKNIRGSLDNKYSSGSVTTVEEFDRGVEKLLTSSSLSSFGHPIKPKIINQNLIKDHYIKIDREYLNQYPIIMFQYLGFRYFIWEPFSAMVDLIKILYLYRGKVLKRAFKFLRFG